MADTKPTAEGDWSDYYRAVESKPLHPLYEKLDPYLEPGWRALELGCGIGHGVLHLIEKGLNVTAVDAQAEALDRLFERLPAGERILSIHCSFQDLALDREPYDLIVAGFSLFFLRQIEFESFWPRMIGSLKPGGLLMCQLLGPNDDWADEDHSFHSRGEVMQLLSPFEILHFEEADQDGAIADGTPKHWHVFHVIARKR